MRRRSRLRRALGALLIAAAGAPFGTLVPAGPAAAATATPGQLVISELRYSGPGGPFDEFVEIANVSGEPHLVQASDGSAGYALVASDGIIRCTLPNALVIPDGGHVLCANDAGYSLSDYGGTGAAAPDIGLSADLPVNVGLALFDNSDPVDGFTLAHRLDAVGSTAEANPLYKEGTGLPPVQPFSTDYSWFRDLSGVQGSITTNAPPGAGGVVRDTDNNAADFVFADTNGTSMGGGQRLGAPGPENLDSPLMDGGIAVSLLDPCVDASSPPNIVRDFTSDPANNSSFGTVDIRRTITNQTGGVVSRLRFRITDIRTFPAPFGIVDLRPRTSTPVVVTVDRDPCGSGTSNTTVLGTALEQPPAQANGGGFNSSMSVAEVSLASPLAPGASLDVRFLAGVQAVDNDETDGLTTFVNSLRVVAEVLSTDGDPLVPAAPTCLGVTSASPSPQQGGLDDFCTNAPPTAAPDAYTTGEDEPLVVDAAAGVLANDSDPEDDTAGAHAIAATTVVDDVDNGTLVLADDGSFSYTPSAHFDGTDSFSYTASDNGTPVATSVPTTVTIGVTAAADAPTADADSYTTPEDTPLVVSAPGVLDGDADPDDTTPTVDTGLTTQPANGSVTLAADGSFTYTPDQGFVGTDAFTYVATDGALDSAPATVTVEVSDEPAAPVGAADIYATTSSNPLVVAAPGVLGNDSDGDGDPLTANRLTDPAHGTVVLAADGSFTYTPFVGFDGTDTFTYEATDGALTSGPVTVTVDVDFAPPASPPAAAGDATLSVSDATPTPGQAIQVTGAGFVPGETVRLVLYSPVSLGSVVANATGGFTTTITVPAATAAGLHTLAAFGSQDVALAALQVQVPVAPTTTTAAPRTLPRTGTETRSGLLLAGLLLTAGGALLLWPERRRL